MTERPARFDLSMPGPHGPIRFVFTSGDERDHIAHAVRANSLADYERPTPDLCVGLIRDVPDLVLDVGANSGIFTLLAAAASNVACVHAFEPLQAARDLLQANIACNPDLAARITVAPFALSNTRGSLPFHETINDQGLLSTSSSLEAGHACQVGPHLTYEIATETLDDWLERAGRPPVQLMKIDVEGHEHAVIEGGRRTIARDRPIIIVEMLGATNFASLSRLQKEDGYSDSAISPQGVRPCAELRFHPDAWNHLLCPVEKVDLVYSVCEGLNIGGPVR
jgi:FkbM family methyltransferase